MSYDGSWVEQSCHMMEAGLSGSLCHMMETGLSSLCDMMEAGLSGNLCHMMEAGLRVCVMWKMD